MPAKVPPTVSANVAPEGLLAEKQEPTAIRAVETKPPTRPLPIERISFAKQLEILRAYDAASGQSKNLVGLDKVGELAGVKADTVSLANRFFVPVGLILKVDAKFRPSDAVHEFAVSVGWKDENAAYKLASVFEGAWFWDAIKPSLTFGQMQARDVLNKLALACDAAPKYEPQLQMLITYLEASGLIARDGNVVTLGPAAAGGSARRNHVIDETETEAKGNGRRVMAPPRTPSQPEYRQRSRKIQKGR